jgi:hypothetical protein
MWNIVIYIAFAKHPIKKHYNKKFPFQGDEMSWIYQRPKSLCNKKWKCKTQVNSPTQRGFI